MNVTHFGDAKKSIQSFDIHPSCKRVAVFFFVLTSLLSPLFFFLFFSLCSSFFHFSLSQQIAYEQDITLWSSNSSNERSGNHRRIPTNAFRRDLRSTARFFLLFFFSPHFLSISYPLFPFPTLILTLKNNRESNFKFIKWLDDDVLANNALFENIKDVDNDDEVKS